MHLAPQPYDQNHMSQSFTQIHPALAALLPSRLVGFCVTSTHDKGYRLFAAGDKPVDMFFVGSGEVVLERVGAQGSLVVLQRCRHGFVGEASLHAASYHCDARVTLSAEISRVPVQALRAAMDGDPAFASRWIAMLNREVRRLRLQCERLSLNKVQDRVFHLIETEGRNGSYALGAGLKSMAADLGVTHEALYRCVASMEKSKLISRSDGCLSLLTSASSPNPQLP
jgi:CRP-like cAMP-binding protein